MDTFGPVSDNAQGIAEMSGDVQGEGARVLQQLDAVGNTTKAITKGIAIATAVLAATALFGSFRTTVVSALADASEDTRGALGAFANFNLSIDSPNVLIGLIIGASVVFLFSGLAIMAVGRAAGRVVVEVREQFRTKPGIMDYTEQPDYDRVVDICTRDAQRELATPGLLAIMTPIAVGFALGYAPLGAFLGGAIAAGVLMAVFLSNSGGAWDNAKKLVEDGNLGGKGSEAHAATVIGDTVGDPFKDTAGPAINPLIKVMNLVSLLIAQAVVTYAGNTWLRVGVTVVSVGVVVAAIVISKRRASSLGSSEEPVEDSTTGPSEGGAADKETLTTSSPALLPH
jgi:K(+)-stimulated pyrophosphate-energized sodium pump